MIVRAPRRIANYRRLGLGAADPNSLDLSDYFSGFLSGGPQTGTPAADGWDGTPSAPSPLCLLPLFPWVGRKVPGTQTCSSVITIPSPWGMVITGVVALLVVKKVAE